MKFDILTLFPEAFSVFFKTSIIGNAIDSGIISYECINFRSYSKDKHNRVDDYTYGGGKGMLIRPEPVFRAYDDIVLKAGKRPKMIYMSPRGKVLNQKIALELSKEDELVILCGHYEGIDQRIIDELCDYELSIGDYVLTGGELPAMILCDCVSRLIPGVLSSDESYTEESHYRGLLEYDQYTRPSKFNGVSVPEVLLTGNKAHIDTWREEKALEITKVNRPDLYMKYCDNEIDFKIHAYNVDLILLGASELVKQEVLLQLEKRNIKCNNILNENSINDFEFQDKTAVLICGDYNLGADAVLNEHNGNNVLFQVLKPFSHKRIRKILYPLVDTVYKPCKNFVTYSEFADEVLRFCSALDNYDIVNECVISNVELICSVPYDLYETYYDKLKSYTADEVFCINSSNQKFNGCAFLKIGEEKVSVEVISISSKFYGEIQLICIKTNQQLLPKLFSKENNGSFCCYLK